MDRHPDTAGGQAPLRALVVDDEAPLVGLVTRYLEREGFQVRAAGDGLHAVELTRLEFDLLEALSERPRVVLSRRQLLERVWGADWYGDDHLVDVHIANLRRKLGDDPRQPRHILTIRGVGYRMGGVR